LLIQKPEEIYKNLPDQGFEPAGSEDDDKEILIISARQLRLTNYLFLIITRINKCFPLFIMTKKGKQIASPDQDCAAG